MSVPKKQAPALRATMAAACVLLSAWGGGDGNASHNGATVSSAQNRASNPAGNQASDLASTQASNEAGSCAIRAVSHAAGTADIMYTASELASGAAITRALASGNPGSSGNPAGSLSGNSSGNPAGNLPGSPIPADQQDGNNLAGIAVDGAGNVFVSSYLDGNVYELPADNPGAVARASSTTGGAGQMTYSAKNDRIYLADWWSGAAMGFDPANPPPVFEAGDASTVVGSWADIAFPTGVAADANGNVYVVENGTVSYSPAYTTTPAGAGTLNEYSPGGAPMPATRIIGSTAFAPAEIALVPASKNAASANIYVTDQTHNQIFKIATNGGVPTVLAGSGAAGTQDGAGIAASFNRPTGIAADTCGNAYVADQGSGRVRRITPQGVVTTIHAFANGKATRPTAIALDARGNIYVATQGAKAGVWKLAPKPNA